MSILETVQESLGSWPKPRLEGVCVIVPTFCLYPSSALIEVVIEGGTQTATVSDGGGAFDEIDGAGDYRFDTFRVLRGFAKKQGLRVNDAGGLYASRVPYSQLPAMIAIVSTASKEAAHHLLNRFKPRTRRDFRKELKSQLEMRFRDHLLTEMHLSGASNKRHKFDYAVPLPGGRQLILDAVLPDSNSINSAVVAHMDLRQVSRDDIEQRIIYDESDAWKSSDLTLLTAGAKPISYSHIGATLDRMAA